MIDVSNEIFTELADRVREEHSPVTVIGESIKSPTKFPCVTIDETNNLPSQLDTSETEPFAEVTYRVQVFCTGEGKRAQARKIFATVSDACFGLNLIRKTYTTTPDVYNSSVYQITATFEAEVRRDGTIFRR